MDFVQHEAEESDGSDREEYPAGQAKKFKKVHDSSEEEEEDEDDETIRREMNDLINDEEEEAESDDDDMTRKRKHDDEEELADDLEDDDYDLLEENLGVSIQRGKKKFKRVRRFEDESDNEEKEDRVEDDREAIANELFEGSDDVVQERRPERREKDINDKFAPASGSEESEDDEDNFIVDDEDRPIQRPKKKKGHRYNDEALQQAQDIFGVEFDFDELEQDAEQDYEVESDEEDEEYENEGADGEVTERPTKKKGKKRRSARKSILDIYEPRELEINHLTEFDNEVRNKDMPERFQLRSLPVTPADDEELEEETEWIYNNAFKLPTISIQEVNILNEKQPIAGAKEKTALPKIKEALKFMRNQLLEVPFIAFYRKEYVEPELNINDLWTIYKWDEKWCQLQQRKINMVKLFKNMQQFQCDQIMKNSDDPLTEGVRLINDTDIEKIAAVNNLEELKDFWVQFQLYYASDVPAMKQEIIRRERERRLQDITADNVDRAFQEEEEAINAQLSSLRLAQRKDIYTICKEARIIGLALRFGLTPEQFGENIQDQYTKHEVEQYPVEPREAAEDYICSRFPTVDAVIEAAKLMVAKQLSVEPLVRKMVRATYFERVKIQVKPTKKGLQEIDENHPCFTQKYLLNKPIKEFKGDQFIQLMAARKDELVEIRFTIDEEYPHKNDDKEDAGEEETQKEIVPEAARVAPKYFDEIKIYYYKDEFSNYVLEWNKLRAETVELALNKFIFPSFEKELISKLNQEAQEMIIKSCCQKLYHWLKTGPYTIEAHVAEDEDFDLREGVRIMGIAFATEESIPTFVSMIDGDGEVTDHLRLPHFMLKRGTYATDKEIEFRNKDIARLRNFILNKKPHVIGIGTDGLITQHVMGEVKEIIQNLSETEGFPLINVEYVDNELSCVYMNSKKAADDFKEYPPLLRQAVSLARRLQDPLIEFSQLCTTDEEILCLKYHHLQDILPKDELLNSLYLEFVNRVNEVGVDVNRALVHPHTAQLVQFICGLGPRKGKALLITLKKQSTPLLESRTQLVMNCNIGAKVFINIAGFIKIDTAQLSDTGTDTYIEVLDSTRVHPEAYEWARKMAVDALEYDDDGDVNPAGALEEILENPEKLKDLDLDAFAEELKRQGFGEKSITLYDIRAELNHRYKDMRASFISLTGEEIFALLTKETTQSLYKGKLVTGQVTRIARKKPEQEEFDKADPIKDEETGIWKCPFCFQNDFLDVGFVWNHFDAGECPGEARGIKVRLDNGLYGFVPIEKISDKEVLDPASRVTPGMTIHCRVTNIESEKFNLKLSCRTSDLSDIYFHWRPAKDFYYDYQMEEKEMKIEDETKKKQKRQTYIKRIIVHPSFHNIDFKQAEKMLSSMDQGEAIIRPSSKGTDHLTLTWKVYDGINQHVDILEEGKDNAFSLGHQLHINGEAYEDLDEIVARYVQPMASFARDLTSFKYFRHADGGKKEVLDKLLNEEKKKQQNKIHYFISASKEYPGKFLLSYLPRTTVRHEYLSVTPEGIKYRRNVFRSINSLLRWFKEHFRDPIVQTPIATPQLHTPQIQGYPSGSNTTPNIDQAIQRAAASMPSHLFNTLSQVTGQTPNISRNFNRNHQTPGYNTQNTPGFFPPSTPTASSLMTPSYTGAPRINTPRNYPASTPQNTWGQLGKSMPPPSNPPPMRSTNPNRPHSRAGLGNRTPLYATPGASSQMSISPTSSPNYTKGDQTPLVDEWN